MDAAQETSVGECVEVVPARTVLLERLRETPPGVELAGLLASVDRSGLDSECLLWVLRARRRLIAFLEAEFLADMHAVARAVPDLGSQPGRRDQPGRYPWAEVEAACALRWTYGRAGAQMMLADDVIDRLPVVHAALAAGEIDMPKVCLISDLVAPLDDVVARGVVDRVIGRAGRLTTGELRARLRRLVLAADSEVAVKRARLRSAGRRVVGFVNDDQLANLAGYDLAPHRVAAVMERLDAIARAAKAAGDARRVDQLRADAFLDLLVGDGVAVGGPVTDGGLDGDGGDGGATGGSGGAVAGPQDAGPEAAGSQDVGVGKVPWPDIPVDPMVDFEPVDAAVPIDPERGDLWLGGVPEPPVWQPDDGQWDQGRYAAGGVVVDDEQWDRQRLWLAGFDQLARSDPTRAAPASVPAGLAAASAPAAATAAAVALPGPRRGVVELQVPLTTLMGLSRLPGELAGWAPVVADIARQVAEQMRDGTWRFSAYDRFGELACHGITKERPGASRVPTAEQAAYVRARDRTCVAPGCRRAARMCDIDHTLAWIKGGPTETCNLGLLCRLHHLFKHSLGCELLQVSSGVFFWKFPSGLEYVTTPDTPLIDDNQLIAVR